ncbi:MAG: hypothetical protein JWP10_730 [Nocardioidaceae bacterium]|nr:hypothetical protein [Nocardioidaceae bacterium]
MVTKKALLFGAVIAPPVIIAVLGVTHPRPLTHDSSLYWRNLHIALLPLFPLLALGPWLVARSVDQRAGRLALVLGYVYAAFYSALDVLAGIGAGGLKHDHKTGIGVLFRLASTLGEVGSYAFIGATMVAVVCALAKAPVRSIGGSIVVVTASVVFWQEHIYWPKGALAMAALAIGWGWIAWAVGLGDESKTAISRPGQETDQRLQER